MPNAGSVPKRRRKGRRSASFAVLVTSVVAMLAVACATPAPLVPIAGPGGPVSVARPDVVGPLRVVGRDLVDATGRIVQIHGVNSVAKWAPWVTPVVRTDGFGGDTFTDEDLAALDRDGFNGVRLGVRPAELMPTPGTVDESYLDLVQQTVDRLESHSIWVLLDLHQDVFSGMPSWASTPAAAALDDSAPAGLGDLLGWSAGYFSPRSLRQWDDWWSNTEIAPGLGVVDAYSVGVAAVAGRFADSSAVIGLDLMNEPFPGSPALECLVGGCPSLDAKVTAVQDRLTAAARAAAPQLPVWWEQETLFPVYADSTAPAPSVPSTDSGPGIVASFHAYCLDTDAGQPVEPSPIATWWCDGRFNDAFTRATSLADRWEAPAVITEFGASRSPLNVTLPTRLADENLVSWFHWHHGGYPDVVESQLVRTYAQATAGRPLAQSFDPATGDFTFRFTPDHSITAPTSILVPQRAYPHGYVADVVGGSVTSAHDSGRLTVVADPGAGEVTVRVTRS